MKKFLLSIIILSLWCQQEIYNQPEIRFNHISFEQGLSNDNVRCIFQDSYGYIWLGTGKGLNRYDGNKMKVFYKNNDCSYCLQSDVIHSVFEDHNHQLWIGTNNGLSLYNHDNETFTNFTYNVNDTSSLSNNSVFSIFEYNNNLLVGTWYGLNVFNSKKKNFKRYYFDNHNEKSNIIRAIQLDKDNNLWIGSENGLFKFDLLTNQQIHFLSNPDNKSSLPHNFIYTIFKDKEGNLWIGTKGGGLSLFDVNNTTFINYQHKNGNENSIINNDIRSIYEDSNGSLWIGTLFGLDIFDTDSKNFTHYQSNFNNPNSLSHNAIWYIYGDNMGGIWIGTWAGELNYYHPDLYKFKLYRHNQNDTTTLSSNQIFDFAEDKFGNIWIGTHEGLDILDAKTQKIKRYFKIDEENTSFSNHLSVADNRVYSVCPDNDKNMWIAANNVLQKYDMSTHLFSYFFHKESVKKNQNTYKGFYHNNIVAISIDNNNRIWVGANDEGLSMFNPETQQFSYFRDSAKAKVISNKTVNDIQFDTKNNLWILSFDIKGLIKMNMKDYSFIEYPFPTDISNLPDFEMRSIQQDSKNDCIWIGTNLGLYVFNIKKAGYSKIDCLPTKLFLSIIKDDRNNIWLGTENSIIKYSIEQQHYIEYFSSDGLQESRFTNNAILKSKDGNLYFGGTIGFNVFHPDSINENKFLPPVVITDFKIFDESIPIDLGLKVKMPVKFSLDKCISETKSLILKHNQNFFSFEFAALNYLSSEKNQYAYILEGFDKNWTYTYSHKAKYANISPGKYVFQLKASNNDNYWDNKGVEIAITVLPPPWKTIWAYFLYFIILTSIIYFIRKITLNQAKLKLSLRLQQIEERKNREVDNMKLQFFTNISHEFRTPLTLIIGPLEKIMVEAKSLSLKSQLQIMLKNSQRLLRLVNQIITFRQLEAGSLQVKYSNLDIVNFLKNIFDSFLTIAEQNNIKYEFLSNEKEIILPFDKGMIEKIIFNLLSNAFKFTPEKGEITLEIKYIARSKKEVLIKIIDNGIGIPHNQQRQIFNRFFHNKSENRKQENSGIGLALAKELIELHNGKILVESEINKGSLFTVVIPIIEEIIETHSEKISTELNYNSSFFIKDLERTKLDNKVTMNSLEKKDAPIILVAEDNHDLRKYICSELHNSYQLLEADNGQKAWELTQKYIPDLIISDIMMPKMDGLELCNNVKTTESTAHIPIIILTAKTTEENMMEGLETGADLYVTKPFSAKILFVQIHNLLALRETLRKKFQIDIEIKPKEVSLNSIDEQFLKRSLQIVEDNLSDINFDVDQFVNIIGMSRSQLYRKIKMITGQSVKEFIRVIRLKKAARLLKNGDMNITEITYEIGISNRSYFSKCFKEMFGVLPSEY